MRKRLNKTKGNGKKKVISTASSQYSGTRSVVIQFFLLSRRCKAPISLSGFFYGIFIALFLHFYCVILCFQIFTPLI